MSADPIAASIARVRAYVASGRVRKSRLALNAGLDKNALKRMDRDDWNPQADTLQRLLALIPNDFGQGSAA